jgi:hypothetical protein
MYITAYPQYKRRPRNTNGNRQDCHTESRIDPSVKEALRVLAAKEHRNVANMIEIMIRDYCKRNGGSGASRPVVLWEFSARSAANISAVGC